MRKTDRLKPPVRKLPMLKRSVPLAASGNGHTGAGPALFDMAAIAHQQRRTYEAMLAANRTIAASMRAIADEQCALLRDCVGEAVDAVKDAAEADNAVALAQRQAAAVQRAVTSAAEHASHVASIAARSGRELARVLGAPLSATLRETGRLARPGNGAGTQQ